MSLDFKHLDGLSAKLDAAVCLCFMHYINRERTFPRDLRCTFSASCTCRRGLYEVLAAECQKYDAVSLS